ncbi:iron complex outermembrane receptor protein [Algoriphagus sp. 4150]|uniref:TonB-dependent siderophore receptor n=1 Tax=Algoriphagus sp. 4150 TaxID=2817756 RepID=UPI0028636B8D|nr:TonB-dependent receptor [Algoriphagus sp. 4150]MDR7128206.1 iron complex outermembrane receptor protein [Algoriphagus sp. 4150]
MRKYYTLALFVLTGSMSTVFAQEAEKDTTKVSNLMEVVVLGTQNIVKNANSEFVAKMPLKNLENPQVYTSVSAELMKEQVISNYDDALRNVPGIAKSWESTGRGGDGGAYFSLRGFEAQPALVNGLPGLVSGNLDPSNVEEIQVIKGPSGTLFGASFYGYGGIINTITKKPYLGFGGEVAYNTGSFGLHRLTVDVNTPLNKTKKMALRLNTALHTENSFQDAGFKKSFFISPTFAYEVNDKLTISLLMEILEEKRAVPPVLFHTDRQSPLEFKNIEELNLNNKMSFTNNDLTIMNPRKNLQAQALYKLGNSWNSQTVFSASNIKSDGIYTYLWGTDPDQPSQRDYFYQYFNNQDYNTNTLDVQQNFNGDFKIGKLRNMLLIGVDFFTRTVENKSSGWIPTRRINPQGDFIALDPSNPDGLNSSIIADQLAASNHSNTKITNSAYSAYVSDMLQITPTLSTLIGLRLDYFNNKTNENSEDYNQLTFSPKFGLVYQPIDDKLSLFGNYMNTFYNVAPREIFDDGGNSLGVKTFKPEHANQMEAGAKTILMEGKLSATVSLYDVRVSNRVYYSPTSAIQGGKTRSRGFELEIKANPIPRLNFIAGFSYGKIEVTEGNTATPNDFYNEEGRSPGGQGPQTLANFWGTYKIDSGKLKNFGLGFGGNYAGVYKVIDNSVTGVFNLPSYTLLNSSLFYSGERFTVSANVNNLTNETYYIGYWSVNPQKPRNFAARVAYKF